VIPEIFAGLLVLYVWGADFGPIKLRTWTVTEYNHGVCQQMAEQLKAKGFGAECGEEL